LMRACRRPCLYWRTPEHHVDVAAVEAAACA
jgi:hypothetical protein